MQGLQSFYIHLSKIELPEVDRYLFAQDRVVESISRMCFRQYIGKL